MRPSKPWGCRSKTLTAEPHLFSQPQVSPVLVPHVSRVLPRASGPRYGAAVVAVRIVLTSDDARDLREELATALGVNGFHDEADGRVWIALIDMDGRRTADEVVDWVRERITANGWDEDFSV